MGFLKGSIAFGLYTMGPDPDKGTNFEAQKANIEKQFAFQPIDSMPLETLSIGLVSIQEPFALPDRRVPVFLERLEPWGASRIKCFDHGGYLFGVRIDTRKIPSGVKHRYLEEEIQKEKKADPDNPNKHISRARKAELKAKVEEQLLRKTTPSSDVIECLYFPEEEMFFVFSSSAKKKAQVAEYISLSLGYASFSEESFMGLLKKFYPEKCPQQPQYGEEVVLMGFFHWLLYGMFHNQSIFGKKEQGLFPHSFVELGNSIDLSNDVSANFTLTLSGKNQAPDWKMFTQAAAPLAGPECILSKIHLSVDLMAEATKGGEAEPLMGSSGWTQSFTLLPLKTSGKLEAGNSEEDPLIEHKIRLEIFSLHLHAWCSLVLLFLQEDKGVVAEAQKKIDQCLHG